MQTALLFYECYHTKGNLGIRKSLETFKLKGLEKTGQGALLRERRLSGGIILPELRTDHRHRTLLIVLAISFWRLSEPLKFRETTL